MSAAGRRGMAHPRREADSGITSRCRLYSRKHLLPRVGDSSPRQSTTRNQLAAWWSGQEHARTTEASPRFLKKREWASLGRRKFAISLEAAAGQTHCVSNRPSKLIHGKTQTPSLLLELPRTGHSSNPHLITL